MSSIQHPLYEKLRNYRFILGSSSPRRHEIVQRNLGIENVIVKSSEFEENLDKTNRTIEQYVTETSLGKAKWIIEKYNSPGIEPSIILTSDTIISCNGEIFEKPGTQERQREMFAKYKAHPQIQVMTSVTVVELRADSPPTIEQDLAITKLTFEEASFPDLVEAYIASEEGLHVAGGFKYQELGCLLFAGIEGDYFNVVGLPVATTFKLLQRVILGSSS
ncbi:Maf-like protein [Scheffersomyces xylosifermentans]|uniref:Maf-like protein n=1 Tax=Scheffersomyces xylosifermentans TaxID=1304137 RepID=UPI00315C97FD